MRKLWQGRLFRTSGFRLALQSAALSIFGALIVFAIIYNATEGTLRGQIDAAVISEQSDLISDFHKNGSIIETINNAKRQWGGTFYALTGPDGAMLAGNLELPASVTKSWDGWKTLDRRDGVSLPPHVLAIRGFSFRLPSGDRFYVAENASALAALNALIADTFLAVFGVSLTLGLAGGVLVARSSLKHVEVISDTSRDIMGGDLSRRIPLNGTGDEFDRLAINLNTMLARIQALMENIRQVTNDIAHDLRSPLARLRERLELARHNTTDAAMQTVFDDAIGQVDAALNIFAAMLRIAEIEGGARRSHFVAVDLSHLLHDLAETYETVADSAGQSLFADIGPNLVIKGDRELLTQMLVNIIENAIRHCPTGSRINIAGRKHDGDLIEVTVADNGIGIPAHERTRVLQRFVRLDASRHSEGTGLGLALVVAIVELHGGTIALEDNHPGLKVLVRFSSDPHSSKPAERVTAG